MRILKSYWLFCVFVAFSNQALSDQKTDYQAAKRALLANDLTQYHTYVKTYSQSGSRYYLDFYYYLNHVDLNQVIVFLNSHQTRAFYPTLLSKVVQSYQKDQNWQGILKILNSNNANTLSLKCMMREAYFQTNKIDQAFAGLANLYIDNQMPNACLPLLDFAFSHQKITQSHIHQKIRVLIKKGDLKLARALNQSKNTTLNVKTQFNLLIQLYEAKDPVTLINAFVKGAQRTVMRHITPTDYLNLVLFHAKKDSLLGSSLLDLLVSLDYIPASQQYSAAVRLAIYQAGRLDSIHPLARIKAIPKAFQTDELKQWGFRLSAQNQDWKGALSFLHALSDQAKTEATWLYWLGETYIKLGQIEQGRTYFRKIAHQTNFYGFLASDQLGEPYRVLQNLVAQKTPSPVLLTDANFKMAFDLLAVGENGFARSEWIRALKTSDKNQVYAASVSAYQLGENDLGIRAAVNAQQSGGLNGRYPSLYLTQIQQNAQKRGLDALMILSLMRQESLFQADVKSHADAYGLMQLLIPTANKMSARLKETQRGSLIDPSHNIKYGTEYLLELTEELGRFWPYILSGYNAGPHRVKKWVGDPIDAVLWIESIPFKETRHYVKNILENRVIYGYLNQKSTTDALPKVTDFLKTF